MDRHLKNIIKYAYTNSPYYERLYNKYIDNSELDEIEFKTIPFIEKKRYL